mmetsp:Transcript_12028/g.25085  ORF Transcript_12028/g.25085 Transcript_12028/m.25085 type:complete len:91 (-) Transcript_12028:57-329(-)
MNHFLLDHCLPKNYHDAADVLFHFSYQPSSSSQTEQAPFTCWKSTGRNEITDLTFHFHNQEQGNTNVKNFSPDIVLLFTKANNKATNSKH